MDKVLFFKSSVSGYTRRDGTQVKPYSNKVSAHGLYVSFGGSRYPVSSLKEASDKWTAFRDRTGAGVSEIGNGVEVHDQNGKLVGRISYNGRAWNPDGSPAKIATRM